MALTAIKLIRNQSNVSAYVKNNERPEQTPGKNGTAVGPGGESECNIWIPWADDQNQFDHGSGAINIGVGEIGGPFPAHITILIGGQNISIWQTGDYVCYSINVGFIPNHQTPVHGNSTVGGDRDVDIVPDSENVGWDLYFH